MPSIVGSGRIWAALLMVAAMAAAASGAVRAQGEAARAQGVGQAFDALPGAGHKAHVHLITDNHEAWYARWYSIVHAAHTIDCTYFTVSPDIVGESLLGLLLQKAREGVAIRLLVDQRGSLQIANPIFHKAYLPALVHFPNVKVRLYNAFADELAHLPAHLVHGIASSHSKILIVDGQTVITGGRNIQEHWFTSAADDPLSVHDVDVFLEGETAGAQARHAFEDEWNGLDNAGVPPLSEAAFEAEARLLDTARQSLLAVMEGHGRSGASNGEHADAHAAMAAGPDLAHSPDPAQELALFKSMNDYAQYTPFAGLEKDPVVVLGKHSLVDPAANDVTGSLLKLIGACKTRLTIANPYMVLTDRAKQALTEAGRRGVQISYVTNSPESTDSIMTQAWFVKEWKSYMRDIPNLRIFALGAHRKLHGKVFSFDDSVAVVGSYNMDPMSEGINAEDVAVVKSARFASHARQWIDGLHGECLEYRIRVNPDGSITQLAGPSDQASRRALLILALIGHLTFLRPVI